MVEEVEEEVEAVDEEGLVEAEVGEEVEDLEVEVVVEVMLHMEVVAEVGVVMEEEEVVGLVEAMGVVEVMVEVLPEEVMEAVVVVGMVAIDINPIDSVIINYQRFFLLYCVLLQINLKIHILFLCIEMFLLIFMNRNQTKRFLIETVGLSI